MIHDYGTTGSNYWTWLRMGNHFPHQYGFFWEECFDGLLDAPDWIPSGSVRRNDTISMIEVSVISRG
jgi:hypothetical protein